MKKSFFFAALFSIIPFFCLAQWQPAGDRIRTVWADQVDPDNVLGEYPRPLIERAEWKNLNGLWEYAITDLGQSVPERYDGQILVPFPVESSLSGVKKEVGETKNLWYYREFTVPPDWSGRNIILHFGAVDWETDVWVNDIKIGTHRGGYTPFCFDITPFLNPSGQQSLTVKVWDPTDQGPQPRGKQVKNPGSIWYTSVTGIWQTVWLEPVAPAHISHLKTVPDIDRSRVTVKASVTGKAYGDVIAVNVWSEDQVIASSRSSVAEPVEIFIENPELWCPESPHLYDMTVMLLRDGEIMDEINSYFAMRKISAKRDEQGIMRLQLNNRDIFHFGLLDQGWWPDGLYTAPTDEALKYDIQVTKDLGYNMIRKHVKVEPARWYAHCDRIGILVWQDMPNGDATPVWQRTEFFDGTELSRSPESEAIFRNEWKAVMDLLYSHPSVVVWVPFNEAWGQFKTAEITDWTKSYDPSRLVLPASGGNHLQAGDIMSLHNYPEPNMFLFDGQRVMVQGEYGGIGLALEGHLWEPDRNWGYIRFSSPEEVTRQYIEYANELKKMIRTGFSGAVYTQTTDVEIEVNGIMTYDRKVIKMDKEKLRDINMGISRFFEQNRQ